MFKNTIPVIGDLGKYVIIQTLKEACLPANPSLKKIVNSSQQLLILNTFSQ